jgi:hypothetical protein
MKSGLAAIAVFTAASVFGQPVVPAAPSVHVQATPPAPTPVRAPCSLRTPKAGWNSAAQFIAGINGSDFTAGTTPEQRVAWNYYSRATASDWKRVKAQYLDRIDVWRKVSLASVPAGGVAFYPFSGPDAATVLMFFPEARDYIMVGLEPAGCVQASGADYPADYWPNLRRSLQSVVAMGFFKTDDMRKDFTEGVDGVLPALLFMVARSGFTVTDVKPVGINAAGALIAAGEGVKPEARGVSIRFTDARGGARTLTYFALNLQDSALKRKPGSVKYLSGLPAPNTLVKSASYLMHKKYFSTVRGVILDRSKVVVEDDSGIPYHYFDKAVWDVQLYGHYTKPIEMFTPWYQEDLKTAFGSNAQPLEFGIGYKYRPSSSTLILAKRKG